MGMGAAQQLLFQLPEIDREATRNKVEEALETTRIYKQIGFVPREVKSTPSYEPRFHGPTNVNSKPTEEIASYNVDTEELMRQTCEAVDRAVNRLWKKERDIIQQRYLDNEDAFDYLLCFEMSMSERTYRRIKADAIYKLAFMLDLAVMIDVIKEEKK
jgi:ArpU family phage transcriptional regulator